MESNSNALQDLRSPRSRASFCPSYSFLRNCSSRRRLERRFPRNKNSLEEAVFNYVLINRIKYLLIKIIGLLLFLERLYKFLTTVIKTEKN